MKFLYGKPALVLGKRLLVADLHLGIEFELREKNKIVLPLQHKRVARELKALMQKHGCRELVVLGDAKHDVYGFEIQERAIMREFVELLGSRVMVIKGNHDSELNGVKGLDVIPPQGMVLRDNESGKSFGLFHGHAWASSNVLKADWLLMGHQHPLFEFKEKTGSWRERVWLFGSVKANKRFGTARRKAVVFPAYGILSGGIIVNRQKMIGPFFENKLFDLRNTRAVLLNGFGVGKIA